MGIMMSLLLPASMDLPNKLREILCKFNSCCTWVSIYLWTPAIIILPIGCSTSDFNRVTANQRYSTSQHPLRHNILPLQASLYPTITQIAYRIPGMYPKIVSKRQIQNSICTSHGIILYQHTKLIPVQTQHKNLKFPWWPNMGKKLLLQGCLKNSSNMTGWVSQRARLPSAKNL